MPHPPANQDYELLEDNTGIRRQRPQQKHRRIKKARDAEAAPAQQQDAARALQVRRAGTWCCVVCWLCSGCGWLRVRICVCLPSSTSLSSQAHTCVVLRVPEACFGLANLHAAPHHHPACLAACLSVSLLPASLPSYPYRQEELFGAEEELEDDDDDFGRPSAAAAAAKGGAGGAGRGPRGDSRQGGGMRDEAPPPEADDQVRVWREGGVAGNLIGGLLAALLPLCCAGASGVLLPCLDQD